MILETFLFVWVYFGWFKVSIFGVVCRWRCSPLDILVRRWWGMGA